MSDGIRFYCRVCDKLQPVYIARAAADDSAPDGSICCYRCSHVIRRAHVKAVPGGTTLASSGGAAAPPGGQSRDAIKPGFRCGGDEFN